MFVFVTIVMNNAFKNKYFDYVYNIIEINKFRCVDIVFTMCHLERNDTEFKYIKLFYSFIKLLFQEQLNSPSIHCIVSLMCW